MNLYTPYTPPKDEKKELLLQRHYSTAESNAAYTQLTFSARNTENDNPPLQQLTQVIHLNENLSKPKRSQVKNACVNCQKACKKCDEGRPCQRCIKYNLVETCQDSIRKERKKGVKRGPYKRTSANKLKETKDDNKKKLKKQIEKTPQQWPVHDEVTTKVSSINGSQQQAKQMSVLPNNGEKCEMKLVTPSPAIASYHDSMSKYTANSQQIYFSQYQPAIYDDFTNHTNANLNGDIQINYDNNNITTMPSPMSNHNDSSVVMTSADAYMPSVPHEQDITNMYTFYVQNNMHLENSANIYGTPTGSPIQFYSSNQVPITPWGVEHRFLSNADLH